MEGLVNILPSRGIIVAPMDPTQHIRLLETRRSLEILAAELASQRTNPSERDEFRALAAEFRAAGEASDERAFLDADHRFNALLLAAAKNDFAPKCMHLMSGLSRRHFYYYRKLIDIAEVALLHAEIADAISIGNSEDARRSVNKLMDFNEAFTRRAIDTPWAAENP